VQCDDPQALAATVFELEDRLATSIETARFSESVRTERAVEIARAQLLDSLKQDRAAEAAAPPADSEGEFEEFARTMSYREQQLELRLRTQVQQLREKQGRELAHHDQQWLVEPKQRRFNRSSQKLRILRLQRQLLLTHRIDEPPSPTDRAARDNTQADFEASRAQLEQKHADELETLIQACDLRRGELRYIKDTLAKQFAPPIAPPKPEQEVLPDPDGFWARAKKGEIDGVSISTGSRRKVQVSKTPTGTEVNATLPLPRLETDSLSRRKKVGP
jgi:hypothetical protein